jgi:2'-hydroxyisoflavone reductase
VLDDCLAAAKEAGAPAGKLTWTPLEFLNTNNVQPWSDLPAWVPSADPEYAGFAKRSGRKSVELGARFRPVKETATDILKWWAKLPEDRRQKLRSGLSSEREDALLKKLHA